MKENNFNIIFYIFLIVMFICAIFEVIILGFAFFGADKVECNLLWCTFTTENYINDTIVIRANKICYFNKEKLPCNSTKFENIPIIDTDGNFN